MKNTTYIPPFVDIKNKQFYGRYLPYGSIEKYLKSLPANFNLSAEGQSVLNKNIYSLTIGRGNAKVMFWSQMHGNESTTTKAVLDLLNSIEILQNQKFVKDFLEQCTLKVIVVLNPDGLTAYTRVNANEVDLNRDAQNLSQPESNLLRNVFDAFQPDFCLNLHDQRTIFSAGNTNKSATVSFLAPAYNKEREVNETRLKAMQIIVEMNQWLQLTIPNQIGRYDDGFNINCVGDTFQATGVPTILFEAGHYLNDYEREVTRKYIYEALWVALQSIAYKSYKKYTVSGYQKIPENKKLFFDIVIRNVVINDQLEDIAIQFEERLKKEKIHFVPILKQIGNLKNYYGHKEIDGKIKNCEINNTKSTELDTEIQQLTLNNEFFQWF